MSPASEQQAAVMREYVQAVLPLAHQQGQAAPGDLLDEFEQVASLLRQETDLVDWLTNPTVSLQARHAAIERAFRGRIGDLACDTVQVIVRHGRVGMFHAFLVAFRQAVQAEEGYVAVRVTSAVPLAPAEREQVVEVLSGWLGAKAVAEYRVDNNLLGGLTVQVGDEVTDVSLRRQLTQMTDRIRRRVDRLLSSPRPAEEA